MGFWKKVYYAILGYDFVSVDDAVLVVTDSIKGCDVDANGMLNAGEIVKSVKDALKNLTK